jgi:hypothetical protein
MTASPTQDWTFVAAESYQIKSAGKPLMEGKGSDAPPSGGSGFNGLRVIQRLGRNQSEPRKTRRLLANNNQNLYA